MDSGGGQAASRNAIVESYTAILQSVQRKLLIHVPKKNITWRREGKHSSEGVDRGDGGRGCEQCPGML